MISFSKVVIDALQPLLHLVQTHCALGPLARQTLLYRYSPITITGFPNFDKEKTGPENNITVSHRYEREDEPI